MKSIYKIVSLLLIILISAIQETHAQDPHFSQYFTSPVTINPALVGKGVDNMRLSGIFRSQWWGSSNVQPFYTSAVSFEKRLLAAKTGTNQLGMSLSILSDASNSGLLKNNYFSFGMAYHKSLNVDGSELLSGGLNATYANMMIDVSKLEFQSQFGSNGFQSTPSNDAVSLSGHHYVDVNAGLQYSITGKRIGYNLGLAVFHAGSPSLGAYNNENFKLKPRYSIQGGAQFYLDNKSEIHFSIITELQGIDNFYSAGLLYKINTHNQTISFVNIGCWNRFGDALYPYIALEGKTWLAGITYDIITSQARTAQNQIQSSELSFVWKFGNANNKTVSRSIVTY